MAHHINNCSHTFHHRFVSGLELMGLLDAARRNPSLVKPLLVSNPGATHLNMERFQGLFKTIYSENREHYTTERRGKWLPSSPITYN